MSNWQKIRVTISTGNPELDAEGQFDAFTTGETWNGWLVPYFTEPEGKRVAAWNDLVVRRSADPDTQDAVRWDGRSRAFIMDIQTSSGELVSEAVESRDRSGDGDLVHGIGAYRWTWEPGTTTFGEGNSESLG